ncbi:hypothetical protein DL766_009118 [Monosporascus sp. MC13-8B]|nr:hypothetical protein DL763_008852 [Monosporascus cannonballus]RYP16500.1 hypothetical protein DL766_009118 [Monosporascus sp. MC13-8B]
MGVGRRMKKQGPPEPLSEEHFAKLKRKAGLPVDDVPAEQAPGKKRRRRSSQAVAAAAPKASGAAAGKAKTGGGAKAANGKPNGAKAASSSSRSTSKSRRPEPEPESDDDEDMSDGLGEGFGDSDMEDEFSGLEEGGSEGELGDDFLGSGGSVYDSDSGAQQRAMFSEDEDDSDAEEKLTAANIAGLSRKLDEQRAREEAEAQAELEEAALQTNIDVDRPHVLADEEEDLALKTKGLLAPDLQLLRNRINETIRVLDDFKLAEEGTSRADYTNQLLKDICAYYGYSEFLAGKLLNLFPPKEAFAFFEANETARPVVIRTNTLRTHRRDLAQALINRGVVLEPVGKWSKVGLQVFESQVPLGATPEYLAGFYIIQAASSFLPVMALSPQEGERVLDMASAPGGKTTHMAALMRNKGCIFANDPSKTRSKGLIGNVHRLGCRNVIVCNYDARAFPKVIGGFDRVLLDAPCSGTGVIAKDASVKTNKTEKDFIVLPHTQKQLLLAAIDSVNHASKTGGFLVYSTCSVTVEENEQVVQYALNKRPNVKLVSTDLPFGKEGFTSFMGKKFDPSMRLTRRYYPHTYNVDGFFVAKFQKIGPTPANLVKDKVEQSHAPKEEEVVDKTPIAADEKVPGQESDDFGGFDDEEDEQYMEKARRNAMRRRGLDPRALDKSKTANGKTDGKTSGKATEKTNDKTAEKANGEVGEKSNGKVSEKTNGKVTPRPYSIGRRPSFGEWLRLAAPDLLSLLVLGALAIAIATRPPARTHLFPVIPGHVPDLQYAYLYRDRIIPNWATGLIAVGVPAAVILLLQIRIRSFWDAHGALLGLATALLCASTSQVTLKWICGGLRPHFYDRCRPGPSALSPQQQAGTGYGSVMHTTAACTRRAGLEGDAVASFPSGHAAALWVAMGFLALYLNAKLKALGGARQAPAWKLAALLAPPLAAATTTSP